MSRLKEYAKHPTFWAMWVLIVASQMTQGIWHQVINSAWSVLLVLNCWEILHIIKRQQQADAEEYPGAKNLAIPWMYAVLFFVIGVVVFHLVVMGLTLQ